VNSKHEPAEKPSATPDKTPPKAVGAAAGATAVPAPHGHIAATPKREYPTLGYE
jgi:hypothetical protein